MQKCYACQQWLAFEAFTPSRQQKVGRACRSCENARAKARNATEEGRAQNALSAKAFRQRQRKAVLALLGEVCSRCGFSDVRALQIDHVHGGGHAERTAEGFNYIKYMNTILKDPSNYQLLCANCNWIKRVENHEVGRG